MVEPVSSAVASAIVGGTVSEVWGYIMDADDPEEKWQGSVETCIVEARSSIENYDLKLGSKHEQMKHEIGNIGDSAQQLAVRGNMEDFDGELISLLENLAKSCIKYSNSSSFNDYEAEEKFMNELEDISNEITTITRDN